MSDPRDPVVPSQQVLGPSKPLHNSDEHITVPEVRYDWMCREICQMMSNSNLIIDLIAVTSWRPKRWSVTTDSRTDLGSLVTYIVTSRPACDDRSVRPLGRNGSNRKPCPPVMGSTDSSPPSMGLGWFYNHAMSPGDLMNQESTLGNDREPVPARTFHHAFRLSHVRGVMMLYKVYYPENHWTLRRVLTLHSKKQLDPQKPSPLRVLDSLRPHMAPLYSTRCESGPMSHCCSGRPLTRVRCDSCGEPSLFRHRPR